MLEYGGVNQSICLLFTEYKQACGWVHQQTLWEILNFYGVHLKLIKAFKVLYRNIEIRVALRCQTKAELQEELGRVSAFTLLFILYVTKYWKMDKELQLCKEQVF
jgi:hypothetical protein